MSKSYRQHLMGIETERKRLLKYYPIGCLVEGCGTQKRSFQHGKKPQQSNLQPWY